jgi:threonine dehydrogenase-like Zn-dependent dehydrogenase
MAVRTKTTFTWGLLHGLEGKIEVSCHFDGDDLRVMLQLMQQGLLQTEPIISHCVSINESPNIYALMRDRPSELYGVIFDWTT